MPIKVIQSSGASYNGQKKEALHFHSDPGIAPTAQNKLKHQQQIPLEGKYLQFTVTAVAIVPNTGSIK